MKSLPIYAMLLGLAGAGMGLPTTADAVEGTRVMDIKTSENGNPNKAQPDDRRTAKAPKRQVYRSGYPENLSARPSGPGYTQRQVQRMARKKANVAANRRAHRG